MNVLFKVTARNPNSGESIEVYVAAVNPTEAETKALDYIRRTHEDAEMMSLEVVANSYSIVLPASIR